MNNTLIIISIAQLVIFIIFMSSFILYLKKNTMQYLIRYSASSLIMCALAIIVLLIADSFDKSYKMYIFNVIIYAVNFLFSIFMMGTKFGRNKS